MFSERGATYGRTLVFHRRTATEKRLMPGRGAKYHDTAVLVGRFRPSLSQSLGGIFFPTPQFARPSRPLRWCWPSDEVL